MTLTLMTGSGPATPPPPPPATTAGEGAYMLNNEPVEDFAVALPFKDLVSVARIWVQQPGQQAGSGLGLGAFSKDPQTWLPNQIPGGYSKIMLFWSFGNQASGSPVFGTYALRHDLPGTFTLQPSGALTNVTTVSQTRTTFTVPDGTGDWSFEIIGPSGSMPDNYTIEVVRLDQEADFDNENLSWARRRYTTEYLALQERVRPSALRQMNAVDTNNNLGMRFVSNYPPDTARNFSQNATPLNLICALCNELESDCWFNVHARASDALIDHFATYLRDNLDADRDVYVEYGNENWNSSFSQTRVSSGKGIEVLGTEGPGTVSTTAGGNTVTATGVNLTTIFSNGDQISIGGVAYTVNTVFSGSLTLTGGNALDTLNNVNYYYAPTGDHFRQEGYRVDATNVMERFKTIFAATPERLIRVAAGFLAASSFADRILDNSWWISSGYPGYVPAVDAFDAFAINSYIASTFFNVGANKTEVTNLWNGGAGSQATRDFYADMCFGRQSGFSTTRDFPDMEGFYDAHRAILDPLGLRLLSYEGGFHIIHNGTVGSGDTAILDSFLDFLQSPECTECIEYHTDMQKRYHDGPPMMYRISHRSNNVGLGFALYRQFNQADDGRTVVIEAEKDTVAYWRDDAPTVWAKVRDFDDPDGITLAQGATLELSEWTSRNATSWGGTGPGGNTPNPTTGALVMPNAASGPTDYTLTAASPEGTIVEQTVRITVT